MKHFPYIAIFVLVILLIVIIGAGGLKDNDDNDSKTKGSSKIKSRKVGWVTAWTASLQAPFEVGTSSKGFQDQTLRFIIKPHIDGKKLRIRLSNIFGSEALKIDEVQVAISKDGPKNVSGSEKQLTFDGKKQVRIPKGKQLYSDPIAFDVSSKEKLAVSMYLKGPTGPASWHPHAMQTSYTASGNHAATDDASAYDEGEEAWFWLDGMDVKPKSSVDGAVAVVGSSIANGNHSSIDKDHRWPDYLAKRILAENSKAHLSVLNAGISANQMLNSPPEKGEHMLARLDRDVFSQSGMKAVILHGGLNDIRHHPEYPAEKITDRMKEIIDACHKKGLRIYGATMTPFEDASMYAAEGEKTRNKVNDWIRSSGAFDGVIDFDKALRDPDKPGRFLPAYDSGDHLHPSDKGYEKMADVVDLSMFQ